MVTYTKRIFITSLVIAIIVFVAGILLGYSLDGMRNKDLLENLRQSELNTESYLVHQTFLETFGGNECEVLTSRINDMKDLVTSIGSKLTSYSTKSMSESEDMDYLKRKYFISEIKFLTLLQHLKENCEKKFVIILFFYTKDDATSTRQGYILTDLNEKYEDSLIILSLDKDYSDEPLIKTLKLKYNIKESSTLIINNNIKKEGLITEEELIPLIELGLE